MIKKAGRSFTTAYLLLIFGIYPLYMHRGYVDIAQAKYHFFIYCSLAGLVILTAAGAGLMAAHQTQGSVSHQLGQRIFD
ncbi:hypothetical protein [Parablautia intestinalis]|uniref:hypothetical protein n=1 Tax=Parablautia intestinalis TaxID=2320100 RepID=UPI00256EAD8C|nr:hypothetical protein [Parablautia intestinalis]